MIKEIISKEILNNFPRILGMINKNPIDDLCGSFDRDYWAWNFKDYPNLSLQSGIYLVALLWNTDFDGNIYYKDEEILNCIKKSLSFWIRNQKKNGSFDQCYYNERSYGTTSYTLIAILKTYPIIVEFLTDSEEKAVLSTINKASTFLLKHSEKYGMISNHQAQYMYVFLLLKKFLNNDLFETKCRKIITFLHSFQDEEGWFIEYEGVDIGYLSQTIYYLSLCYKMTNDKTIFKMLQKAIEFYSYFVHPDGSAGGVYGSRYNENFYPAGFAIMGAEIDLADKILRFCINKENGNILLSVLDPENQIRLMTNYMEALISLTHEEQPYEKKLPCEQDKVQKLFKDAGIYINGDKYFYTIISIKKGGSTQIYDKIIKKPLIIDPGYILSFSNGEKISNGVFQDSEFRLLENSLFLRCWFFKVNIPTYTPMKGLMLRVLSLTALRITFLNDWFKKLMVRKLIMNRRKTDVTFEREIGFRDKDISIMDKITLNREKDMPIIIEDAENRTYKMASVGYHFKSLLKIKVKKVAHKKEITLKKILMR
jgi:hypothetical protein